VGVLVIYAGRRLLLAGDRVFALYAALYAFGRFWTQGLEINYSPHALGLRIDQVIMIVVLATAVAYLYLTRHEQGPDSVTPAGREGLGTDAAAEPAAR
jgi:hypothetical protein